MKNVENSILLAYSNSLINQLLKQQGKSHSPLTMHFDHSESFFLKTTETITVPQLPIHHDVNQWQPPPGYIKDLEGFINSLLPVIPQVFADLTYFFDPTHILRLPFFQLYKLGKSRYLYLLLLDLEYKPQSGKLRIPGTNDLTPAYETNRIYFDALLIPVKSIIINNNRIAGFKIDQTLDSTWLGEAGRGYKQYGIWQDTELTKFFSKLFLPLGKKNYPYYPFECQYRTFCHRLLLLDTPGRQFHLKYFHNAYGFIQPFLPAVQESLKTVQFSQELASFQKIKKDVPEIWYKPWDSLKLRYYLNEFDMKEYQIEFQPY